MSLTPAEKQSRYRARQAAALDALKAENARLRARIAVLEKAAGNATKEAKPKPAPKKPAGNVTEEERKARAAKSQASAAINALPEAKQALEEAMRAPCDGDGLAKVMHAGAIKQARANLSRVYARIGKYAPEKIAEEKKAARAAVSRLHPDKGGPGGTAFEQAMAWLDTINGR